MIENPSTRPRISLDSYHGIGNDFLGINNSVADGFMRVSDMRSGIVVVKTNGHRSKPYLDGPNWYVPVNDEELMVKARSAKRGDTRTEENFHRLFRNYLKGKADDCLGNEKLSNAGGDTSITLINYLVLGVVDFTFPFAALAGSLNHGNGLATAGVALACIGMLNAGINMANKSLAAHGFYNLDQPFIRHPLREKVLPPVPIDRLIRGQLYLLMHGDKLVQFK